MEFRCSGLVRNDSNGRKKRSADDTSRIGDSRALAYVQVLRKGAPETQSMSANNLLLWMSARSRGSWQQFRAAVEELHLDDGDAGAKEDDDSHDQFALPLYQTLRFNLQRVGHAEF